MLKWEIFEDRFYYNMYGVRPIDDRNFNSPRLFHFINKEYAEKFKELLEKCYCANSSIGNDKD